MQSHRPRLIHRPRLAWDSARVIVAASESDAHFVWLSDRLCTLLGAPYQRELSDTRMRLKVPAQADTADVETGRWHARLEDLLCRRPELAHPLRALVIEAQGRAARRWHWPIN
jgi:hypothetical protein